MSVIIASDRCAVTFASLALAPAPALAAAGEEGEEGEAEMMRMTEATEGGARATSSRSRER